MAEAGQYGVRQQGCPDSASAGLTLFLEIAAIGVPTFVIGGWGYFWPNARFPVGLFYLLILGCAAIGGIVGAVVWAIGQMIYPPEKDAKYDEDADVFDRSPSRRPFTVR